MDPVIENAAAAEATRNDGPPAPVAPPRATTTPDRQQQINADPSYWDSTKDPNKTRALREEMKRLVADPAAILEQDKQKQEVAAKLTASEKTIAALRERPGFWNKDAAD